MVSIVFIVIVASGYGMEPSLTVDDRYFGKKPTSVTSESNVRVGESSMPWEVAEEGGKSSKYKYHPHGDKNQPLREAPSALNTVIVPNVTLPVVCYPFSILLSPRFCVTNTLSLPLQQDLHERFNKYGKEEWDF